MGPLAVATLLTTRKAAASPWNAISLSKTNPDIDTQMQIIMSAKFQPGPGVYHRDRPTVLISLTFCTRGFASSRLVRASSRRAAAHSTDFLLLSKKCWLLSGKRCIKREHNRAFIL
jgi:hypothetical protein